MNQNTKAKLHGATVALAVAGLMGCSVVSAESSSKTAATSTSAVELAHC